MSLAVNIYAPGRTTRKDDPERDVREVVQGIADRVVAEAEKLALAGYTVDPDSIRLGMSYGSYDVRMEATR